MNPYFEKDDTTSSNYSINQEIQIPKSSFLKIVNDFNASPPLRLCEIFNHLSSDPSIRQELAAYISFQEKCLFIDGFTVYLRFYAFYGFTVIVTVKRTLRCFPWLKGHRFFVTSSRLVSPQSISVNFVWIWIEIYERNDSVNKQVAAL